MKKRIICLLISMILVLGVLVGCGEKEEDPTGGIVAQASKNTITLSMYLVSENEISEEQEAKIENAVNKITKAKFKTQLDLRFFTEDEYYDVLEADLEEDKPLSGGFSGNDTASTEETEEETFVDDDGLIKLVYPEITDYQVDIFYLSGQDRLKSYMEKAYVQNLNDEIANASKLLSSFVAPMYISTMKSQNNGIYALPVNKPIGEYTYLLVNKDVLSQMQYGTIGGESDYSEFTSVTSDACQDILTYVNQYMPEYVPLYSATGALDINDIRYFSVTEDGVVDTNTFSLLGGTYNQSWSYGKLGEYTPVGNILANESFKKQVTALKSYEENGYYADEDEKDKPFAVGYVKGGAEVIEEYGDDYEIITVGKPVLETEELYADMFAVHNTARLARSMEIVTYLNTNTDFRNLILYGIEGENYEIVTYDETDVTGKVLNTYKSVKRLNEDYMMDPNKTGNVLVSYPLSTEPYFIREYQMQQNRDAKLSLVFGLSFANSQYELNEGLMKDVRDMSAEFYDEMIKCETVAELETLIDETFNEFKASNAYIIHSNRMYAPSQTDIYDAEKYGDGTSFAVMYDEWLIKIGAYSPQG